MKLFKTLKMLTEDGEGKKVANFFERLDDEKARIDRFGRPVRRTLQTVDETLDTSESILDLFSTGK